MSHIVVYQADDGSSGFEPCDSLDDAIIVAERIRNVDGVESLRIFRMEEVEIDFRPYYRVEVAETTAETPSKDLGYSAPVPAGTGLDDLPAPPSPEAVAAAEAELGEAVSQTPSWGSALSEETHEEETHEEDDHETSAGDESAGHSDDSARVDPESLVAPIAEDVGSTTDVVADDDSAEGDDGDDDAMISVRRGLFGR